MEFLKRYRWIIIGAGAVIVVVAFLAFRPDKLFVDDAVDESLSDAFVTETVATTSLPPGHPPQVSLRIQGSRRQPPPRRPLRPPNPSRQVQRSSQVATSSVSTIPPRAPLRCTNRTVGTSCASRTTPTSRTARTSLCGFSKAMTTKVGHPLSTSISARSKGTSAARTMTYLPNTTRTSTSSSSSGACDSRPRSQQHRSHDQRMTGGIA